MRGGQPRWLLADALRELPDATPLSAVDADQRAWLAALPRTRTYATPRGALLLCHGLGDDDMATLKPEDAGYALDSNDALARLVARGEHRVVVSGHSHRRMVRRHGGVTFVNAGTLLRGHAPSALVLDLQALTATFFDWDGAAFGGRALFFV